MAEVGLLPFARIALQVSKAVLPRYRSRFSKHQFTQPQLLAILCLMRYEDWTFREAEVRLGEHRELRQILGLTSVPDFTTLYRFLQRWTIKPSIKLWAKPCGGCAALLRRAETGSRRRGRHGFGARSGQHLLCATPASSWAKAAAVAALVEVGGGGGLGSAVSVVADAHDAARGTIARICPRWSKLLPKQTRIGLVLADAEFDSERNHTYIRQQLGAQSVIPAKRGKKTWRVHGVRAEMRRAFPSSSTGAAR